MHIPNKFKQDNINDLIALIQQYPLGTLVTHMADGVDAMHLPLLIESSHDDIILTGHIAKANPVAQNVGPDSEGLVIFNGPNAYISPNHYPSKAEHGKAVPTWNYVVVHAKGLVSLIHDQDWIYRHLAALTHEHESRSAYPWSIHDAPEDYIQKMLAAVVGVRIEVSSLVGQWKLSQNQPCDNQQGVIDGLSALDAASQSVASIMKRGLQ